MHTNEQLTLMDLIQKDIPTITPNENPEKAIQLVNDSPYGFVPVIDHNQKVKGIINRSSIVKFVTDRFDDSMGGI